MSYATDSSRGRTGCEPAGLAALSLAEDSRPPQLASEQLLRGRRVVEIVHRGEVYRLQATRLGKLILTK